MKCDYLPIIQGILVFLSLIVCFLPLGVGAEETNGGKQSPRPSQTLYDISAQTIDGTALSFSQFQGKVLLIVNTASKCGFTPQYEGLEQLYEKYASRGLEVLAFPSNDFLGQEPSDDQNIKAFCKLHYDTKFPLFAKLPVTGEEKQPVFQFLTEQSGDLNGAVRWNFEKFLVDRRGKLRERWRSFTKPTSEKVISRIEELLKER